MNRNAWMNIKTQEQSRKMQPWAQPATAVPWYSAPSGLATLAEGFAPISLSQMDSVALLNRIDTKYVMRTEQLLDTLSMLQDDYRVLSVDGHRLNHYRTLYFDTPDFELYNLHVNERAERYKVRAREYADSNLAFLEVKHKTRKDRTIKDRIKTPRPVLEMTAETESWLEGVFPYDSRQLEPKLWNTFTRVTLVNKHQCERLTLDVDLTFYAGSKAVHLDGIAIAEVKMDCDNKNSPFLSQMHIRRIQPQGFSKYCIGVSMLYDNVKKNMMKPRLLSIKKIAEGASYIYHE